MFYNSKKQLIGEIIRLSSNHDVIQNTEEFREVNFKDVDLQKYYDNPPYIALRDCLYSLSDADLQVIQAVMYIGREIFTNSEEFEKETNANSVLNEFIQLIPYGSKEGTVSQILSKSPLTQYLKSGVEFLDSIN